MELLFKDRHIKCKIYTSFVTRRMVGGGHLVVVPVILGQTDRVGAKSPIFDLLSPVSPQP